MAPMSQPMDQQITAEGPRIAIFNVAMIGHVNPTFALVQELCKRGCKVSYFLPPVASIRAAAVESGAVVEGYLPEDPSDFVMEKCGIDEPLCHAVPEILEDDRAEYERAVWPLAQALLCGEYVIERCRHLGVSVVLYDPFLPLGLLAATKLGIQCASLVTYPGMGSLSGLMSTLEAEGRLERAGAIRKPYGNAIQDKFGVDLSCNLLTRRQFYAKTNFVTTCEDLIAELPALGEQNWADELRKEFSRLPRQQLCAACDHSTVRQLHPAREELRPLLARRGALGSIGQGQEDHLCRLGHHGTFRPLEH